jgi:hypothetical protein
MSTEGVGLEIEGALLGLGVVGGADDGEVASPASSAVQAINAQTRSMIATDFGRHRPSTRNGASLTAAHHTTSPYHRVWWRRSSLSR